MGFYCTDNSDWWTLENVGSYSWVFTVLITVIDDNDSVNDWLLDDDWYILMALMIIDDDGHGTDDDW